MNTGIMTNPAIHAASSIGQGRAAGKIRQLTTTQQQRKTDFQDSVNEVLYGMFFKEMMSQMRKSMANNEMMGGGMGEEMFWGFYDEKLAKHFAAGLPPLLNDAYMNRNPQLWKSGREPIINGTGLEKLLRTPMSEKLHQGEGTPGRQLREPIKIDPRRDRLGSRPFPLKPKGKTFSLVESPPEGIKLNIERK